MMKPGLPYLVC